MNVAGKSAGAGGLRFPEPVAARLGSERPDVVVTGAGGWLGRAALEKLDGVYGDAVGTKVHAFGSAARRIVLRSGRSIPCRPIEDLEGVDADAPIFLHFAFLTRDRVAGMPLQSYVAANRRIADLVSKAVSRHGARGLFVPSSGAVYGPGRALDHDLEANPYGVMKRQDELRFGELGARLGIPTAVIRIFNLSGPFINKQASYALSSIIADIDRGGPIILRATRRVVRSYVPVGLVLDLALAVLLDGQSPEPFDTVGTEAIEIGDLARRAACVLGRPDMAIQRPAVGGEPADIYVGGGDRFAEFSDAFSLCIDPVDLQIDHTAAYLRTPS